MTLLLIVALTLSQARAECRKFIQKNVGCELIVIQTTTKYRYRVELTVKSPLGPVVSKFEAGSWDEAFAMAKVRRRPIP